MCEIHVPTQFCKVIYTWAIFNVCHRTLRSCSGIAADHFFAIFIACILLDKNIQMSIVVNLWKLWSLLISTKPCHLWKYASKINGFISVADNCLNNEHVCNIVVHISFWNSASGVWPETLLRLMEGGTFDSNLWIKKSRNCNISLIWLCHQSNVPPQTAMCPQPWLPWL